MGSNRYYVFTNRSRRYVEEVHDTGGEIIINVERYRVYSITIIT